ncbi:dihydrofolate reductase [Candidatus Riflebacteria bacterium]
MNLIVAMSENRVIGKDNKIPWHFPEDLQLFRKLTMGCTVIMGRRTFTSIGKPLPGRNNIVISRTMQEVTGLTICKSFPGALEEAKAIGKEVFVIGGESLYREALPLAVKVYISHIPGNYEGDRYFPELDNNEWIITEEKMLQNFRHAVYEKRK